MAVRIVFLRFRIPETREEESTRVTDPHVVRCGWRWMKYQTNSSESLSWAPIHRNVGVFHSGGVLLTYIIFVSIMPV